MQFVAPTFDVIEISLASALALSAKFRGCALPILEEGTIVPKSARNLNNGDVDPSEIARAKAEVDKSFEAAASNADNHTPSPLETLQNLLHVEEVSKFFALKIVD